MAIRMPRIIYSKNFLRWSSSMGNRTTLDIPKGHMVVYVGECEKKRFIVPMSYLNQPLFQDLLNQVEEEFGFDHPMGGLTIPYSKDVFIDVTSQLCDKKSATSLVW